MQKRTELAELMEMVTLATRMWMTEWNRNVPDGITPACAAALHVIASRGPQQAKDLSDCLSITSGGITGIADKLATAGLICRKRDEAGDRRAVYLEITEQGRDALKRINEQKEQQLERFFESVPDEDVQHLIRIFKGMIQHRD